MLSLKIINVLSRSPFKKMKVRYCLLLALDDIHMRCPKVGCLLISTGVRVIGVPSGFTRVLVKRLSRKMTRLTPLFCRWQPSGWESYCVEKNYELLATKYWTNLVWLFVGDEHQYIGNQFLIYSTISVDSWDQSQEFCEGFSTKKLRLLLFRISWYWSSFNCFAALNEAFSLRSPMLERYHIVEAVGTKFCYKPFSALHSCEIVCSYIEHQICSRTKWISQHKLQGSPDMNFENRNSKISSIIDLQRFFF